MAEVANSHEGSIKLAKKITEKAALAGADAVKFQKFTANELLEKKHVNGKHDLSTYTNLPLGSSMELINRKALEYSHEHGNKKHLSEFCTLFINENPDKFNILRCLPEKILRRPKIRLTVDTPQDLWIARLIHNSIGIKDKPIPLRKIIKFLDHNSQIKKINSDITIQYKKYN